MLHRLLIVTDTLPPDPNGVALIAVRTAHILNGSYDVHLFGPQGHGFEPEIRNTLIPRGSVGTPDCWLAAGGRAALARAVQSADSVVVHTLGPLGCAALLLARWFGRPVTFFQHNQLPALLIHTLPRERLRPWMAPASRAVEVIATLVANRVVAPPSLASRRNAVLDLAPPRYALQRPSRQRDRVVFAYHGRVSREKAIDVPVLALSGALAAHAELRLIGAGSELPTVLQLAQQHGVQVDHRPWCDAPLEQLAGADAYVMASRTETYSIATLEALGCGLPVIARRVGEIPHFVRHEINGLLFDRDEELAPLMARMVGDENLRHRLMDGARASATDQSVWAQFALASIPASACPPPEFAMAMQAGTYAR